LFVRVSCGNSCTGFVRRRVVRIVAVSIPHFAVVAHRRRDGELRRRPVALVGEGHGRPSVVACSPDAARRGVALGMSGAAVAAACADAAVLPVDLAYCRTEHNRVRDALLEVAPEVEDDALGRWCFAADGLGLLHGDERRLLADVRERLLGAGYGARIAVASNRFTALAAVRFGRGEVACVPRGREAAFLAGLPIEAVPADEDVLRRLRLLGVHTLGALARLPEVGVRARFGDAGAHAHRLARGLDPLPFAPRAVTPIVEVEDELDRPTEALDELLFRLRGLCDRALGILADRGLACWEVRLEWGRSGEFSGEPRAEDSSLSTPYPPLALRLVRPTLSPRALWTLLRLRLERMQFDAPVSMVRLVVVDAPPARFEQRELFRAHRDAEQLEAVVARLRARFGPDGAVSPLLVETHRPERRLAWRGFAETRIPGPEPRGSSLGHVLRIVSPPEPLDACERLGRIVRFTGTGLRCEIARISQPYRLSGEWWDDEYGRDYYIVLTRDERLLWVFRDHASGAWFVHGEFD
jgi:protein ImuB